MQFFTFSAMISTAERSRIWRKQKIKETTLGRSAKVNKVKVSLVDLATCGPGDRVVRMCRVT